MDENSTNPVTELPAVAQNVYIPCKKCGVDRYHKVIAHKTPTSAQVQCEVCGSKKTFKLAKPKAPKKAKTPRKDGKASSNSIPTFNTLKEQFGSNPTLDYKMGHFYKINTPVQHPKFGIGFVVLVTPQRIDVVFEDGQRSLVHNRGN